MGITSYQSKNGTTLYKVSVFLRSKIKRDLQIARHKWAISTLEAAELEHRRILKLAKEDLHKRESESRTLRVLIQRWRLECLHKRVATGEIGLKLAEGYSGTLQKWLGPYLKFPALHLTGFIVQEIVREQQLAGYSRSQLVKFRRMVKMMWDFGIARGLLPPGSKCPSDEVKIAARSEKNPEILRRDETLRLISKAFEVQHPWRHIWACALLTGMRSGELRALMWPQIHRERKRIRVSFSFEQFTGELKSPKNGKWRDVPINSQLDAILVELERERGDQQFVLPQFKEWEGGHQASVLRTFCEEHGLPSIRFHTLRACFATQLVENGVEHGKIQKMAGWENMETMQRYVRLAGIEVDGGTDSLEFLPSNKTANVLSFKGRSGL